MVLSVLHRIRLAFVCLAAIALSIASPRAISPHVVISQIYTAGGNVGAVWTHDYVELHNRSELPVDITGWSVQYASAAGSFQPSLTTQLTGTIQPGGYFLIRMSGGSSGLPLPVAPDATGSLAFGAATGKLALVSSTAVITNCRSDTIVDLVGYGASASCFEGTPAPAPSATLALLRQDHGAIDTDSNGADFFTAAPEPRNSATPPYLPGHPTPPTGRGTASPSTVDAGGTTLLTVRVTPGAFPTSTGLSVTGDLRALGGAAAQPFFDDGTNGDVTAGDLVFSFETTVGNDGGSRAIVATVNDVEGRSSEVTFFVSVAVPIAIHAIQGTGLESPLVNQAVTTTGIVTAVRPISFYIQATASEWDADPHTSEGILVFVGSRPAVVRGDIVQVNGMVQEFRPAGSTFTVTEITSPVVTVMGHTEVPAPIALTTNHISPRGSLTQLEPLEGMRVMADVRAASGTLGFTRNPTEIAGARSTSNGDFWAVLSALPRPAREPGFEQSLTLPPGAPCCVKRFDENPERIRVDSDGQLDADRLEVVAGQTISGLVGVLDYAGDAYTLVADPGRWSVQGNGNAVPVPAAGANEFTVASFNMQRMFDTTDDGADDEPLLTAEGYEIRLRKASLAVRGVLGSPDIIGVQEVETPRVLQDIAARINADAVASGAPDPMYTAHLFEGNDIGGIDSGVLVKSSRVIVRSVEQIDPVATYVEPGGAIAILNDRPPVLLEASVQGPGGGALDVTVIVNHLRSLSGIATSPRIREKRRAQAEFLANYIQARQSADPDARIVSVGDYNAFHVSDGLVDVFGTIVGAPAPAHEVVLASGDLVNPNLSDTGASLDEERYSFVFDGSAQALDHILVNDRMARRLARMTYARSNADFPESLRGDASRPERLSDHDMPVAYFAFPGAPIVTLSGGATMTVECRGTFADPGAAAADDDGSLTVTVTGSVDTTACGTYTLTYTADNGYLSASATRTVHVVDTTPPSLMLNGPAAVTIEAGAPWIDPGGAADDACAGVLTSVIVASGTVTTTMPEAYPITYSVSDGFNTSTAARVVTVVDTTPPSITPLTLSTLLLPTPNHKMVDVEVAYEASDATGTPVCAIDVSSSEPLNGPGDGDTEVDWQVLDAHHVRLRAERSGTGAGRTYLIAVRCVDGSGNAAAQSGLVDVDK